MARGAENAKRLSWILVVIAIGLLVAHFVLDAGDDNEAPGWILIAGILIAVSATFVGASSRED